MLKFSNELSFSWNFPARDVNCRKRHHSGSTILHLHACVMGSQSLTSKTFGTLLTTVVGVWAWNGLKKESREINATTNSSVLISYLKVNSVASTVWKVYHPDSKYTHWIGLYLSFHLSWVMGPFVHGRLQNLKTSEDTFRHDIMPLTLVYLTIKVCDTDSVIEWIYSPKTVFHF